MPVNMHSQISRRPLLFGLGAISAALCTATAAVAHPGQHLGLKISISDEEVACEILMSAELRNIVTPNDYSSFALSEEGTDYYIIDPAEEQRTFEAYEEFFKNRNAVVIDGVRVRPLLRELLFIPAVLRGLPDKNITPPPDVLIELVHPIKGHPKQISMTWDLYPQDAARAAFGLDPALEVVAELDAYDENRIVVFSQNEPEVTWHAIDKPAGQRVSPVVAIVEPDTIPIPLLSLGVVGAWMIGLVALRLSTSWRKTRRPALPLSVVAICVALLTHDVLVARVIVPWAENIRVPGAREASEIFTSLQRNVYRAFDYKTESDIYDVLAQSVDGDLLDQIYNEVYQSLILRDQGGAVARVKSVDILDAHVQSAGVLPDLAAAFRVRSRWQVRGAVYHWGHVHSRTNEYKALYTVAERGSNWKITGVEDVEQQRIVRPGDDPSAEVLPGSPDEPF